MKVDFDELQAQLKAAQTQAREQVVPAIRALESMLKRIAPLRGLPVLGQVDGANFRGLRFRASPGRRGLALQPEDHAFVLASTGELLVVDKGRSRLLQDEEIVAEDAPVAAELAVSVLERHVARMKAGEERYQELRGFGGELRTLLQKMAE